MTKISCPCKNLCRFINSSRVTVYPISVELKHSLPRYQNKQNGKKPNKHKLIILVNTNLWLLRLLTVPVQFCPSLIYPGLHVHTYDLCVLLHIAFSWHLPWVTLHSSASVVKIRKIERRKNEYIPCFSIRESH